MAITCVNSVGLVVSSVLSLVTAVCFASWFVVLGVWFWLLLWMVLFAALLVRGCVVFFGCF